MIKAFTLGLSNIKTAAVPSAGTMPADTDLTQLGLTNENSAVLNMEVPEETEFRAEEKDDPVLVSKKAGAVTVEFDLMNPSPEDMVTLMGGTASKSEQSLADNDQWEPPTDVPNIELAVKVTPKQGFGIAIPRASITATFGGTYTKTELVLVHVVAKVLAPTGTNVKRFKLFKV